MKKFEYKTLDLIPGNQYTEENLNKLGSDGWELVTVTTSKIGYDMKNRYIFKREVK